jgi:hypothetical protein
MEIFPATLLIASMVLLIMSAGQQRPALLCQQKAQVQKY